MPRTRRGALEEGGTRRGHPHIHFVVPALGYDGEKWKESRKKNFLLPVRVLQKVFRGKFLSKLEKKFPDTKSLLRKASRPKWQVYAKKPFGSPEAVLKYLSRYTHRIAISNKRILSYQNGEVTFSYKDYKNNAERREMTLPVQEFLRRFFQHIVPKNFCRIRYYGFLSCSKRKKSLLRAKKALDEKIPRKDETSPAPENEEQDSSASYSACSECGCLRFQVASIAPIKTVSFLNSS